MHFDKNPRRKPSSPRKSTDPVAPNFQLSPTSNINIPKNNVGAYQNDGQPRPTDLIGFNPNDGTYSPIPQHYTPSNLDWEEQFCGFAPVPLEDNILENYFITTQNNNPPAQDTAQQNDDMFNQLNSIFNYEIPANKSNGPHQKNILASNTAPQNTNGQYLYNSLEQALNFWISRLEVDKRSKPVYKNIILTFVKLLDLNGIYNPSQKQIKDYCNNCFRPNEYDNIRKFELISTRFFKWIVNHHIYSKIRPHKSITKIMQSSTPTKNDEKLEISIDASLSKLMSRWLKSPLYDHDTRLSYKIYILNLIAFLAKIHSLSPTIDDMKTYFQNNPELQSPSMINESRLAIAGFLKFIEDMGFSQHHDIYDFLLSVTNYKIKKLT